MLYLSILNDCFLKKKLKQQQKNFLFLLGYPPNAKPASLSRSMISKPGPFEGDFPPGSPPLQMFSPNNRNMRVTMDKIIKKKF